VHASSLPGRKDQRTGNFLLCCITAKSFDGVFGFNKADVVTDIPGYCIEERHSIQEAVSKASYVGHFFKHCVSKGK
jgi:hypothetical protein